jgi:phage repressor protein C with HTH and peptisase S24 domain
MMDGGIYVISSEDGILVKRIHFDPFSKTMTLISDNQTVPPISITADQLESCRIIGRVVGHLDKI